MLLVALLWLARAAISPTVLHGRVFVDRNANGQYDRDEAGVAGVVVSDGRQLVVTDAEGRYRMSDEGAAFIFVIKPAIYDLPLDEFNKPRFYHDLRVGDRSERDFALRQRSADSDVFSILVFGDPQPYRDEQLEAYRRGIVEDVRNPEAYRFGLTLGDIVGDVPSYHEPMAQATASLGVPWWYVLGNHDLDPQASSAEEARGPFQDTFGPTHYAFNEGKVHFIVLDSVVWRGPTASDFVGGLNQDQIDFVGASLQHVPSDHLVVLALHVPPLGEVVFKGMFRSEDRKKLFAALGQREVLTLAAHTHTQLRVDFDQAFGWSEGSAHHLFVVGTTAGDGWSGTPDQHGVPDATMRDGTPKGYARIDFDGPRYQLNWKVAGQGENERMRVHAPAAVRVGEDAFFYVNYYMGFFSANQIKTPVAFRIDEDHWQSMWPSLEADPYRIALEFPWTQAHWSDESAPSGRKPKPSLPSLHLWKARLPSDLAPGQYRLQIRATEPDGREFFDHHDITVLGDTPR